LKDLKAFKDVASVLQYKIKDVLKDFPDPLMQQAVLIETAMEIIMKDKNPQKCLDVAVFIMNQRFKGDK
jgi:hypothetical protein